jgi:hypothetical protein
MIDVKRRLNLPAGESRTYCSLPALERSGPPVSRVDGLRIRDEDVDLTRGRWAPSTGARFISATSGPRSMEKIDALPAGRRGHAEHRTPGWPP